MTEQFNDNGPEEPNVSKAQPCFSDIDNFIF